MAGLRARVARVGGRSLADIASVQTRIAEAGYSVPGPCRPPYDVFPEEYAEASRECGRRWKLLREEVAAMKETAL